MKDEVGKLNLYFLLHASNRFIRNCSNANLLSMSRVTTLKFLLMLMLLGVGACSSEGRTQKKLAQDTAAIQSSETNLTFNNVTLEQTDAQGRPLWKVKTQQAIYSKDKKIAQVQNPFGDLFQDGKLVYQITAQQGEVYEEGNKIILRGQIVAVDTQNKAVLRGNEMEWRPKEDVLIVRDRVNGTHKQMQVAAQEARSFSRAKRMELVGQVVAIAKEPPLHIKGEYLVWQMEQEKVTSDRFIQIDRYDKNNTITDRASGQQGEVDLKAKIATLKQNAQVIVSNPPVQVTSNLIVWNVNAETIVSDQPVQMFHREHQMTVTATKGRVDLKPKIAYLNGNVQGVEMRRQSKIFADQMTWTLPTQVVEATGNVNYQQVNPPMNLTGPKAVGKLQDQTVVVSGGGSGNNNGQVSLDIIPEQLKKR